MCGNCIRHGWWNASTPSARDTTHCMNCGVLLITCGEHNAIGDPIVRKNRYQVWAMQSLVMPDGINWASSSTGIWNGEILFISLGSIWRKKFIFLLIKKMVSVLSFFPRRRTRKFLHIFSSGNDGPYKNSSKRAVNARLTRFHCSISAMRCLSSKHDSCSVFQSDGDGKLRTHAMSHTSKRTLNTRSQSWSLTSSFAPGGASRTSFIASKNSSSDSHVSGVSFCDDCATCCKVRSTRWHRTAWRFIKSAPESNQFRISTQKTTTMRMNNDNQN